MILIMFSWKSSSYPVPKSLFQTIGYFMSCDEFFAFVIEICGLISLGMNSNLS